MENSAWIPLVEYSAKHKLSLSTLRRRIKSDSIEYRLESGKYFILDQEGFSQIESKITTTKNETEDLFSLGEMVTKTSEIVRSEDEQNIQGMQTAAENAFLTAKELLDELKKSYTFILQEKEEQILYLKNEISDLRTLVRVLEEDNGKLRKYVEHLHNISEV